MWLFFEAEMEEGEMEIKRSGEDPVISLFD